MIPTPAAERAALRVLVTAGLVQVLLVVGVARAQVIALFSPGGLTRPQIVGTSVSGLDPHGYYAWLRSSLVDGDWDFANEFDYVRSYTSNVEVLNARTPNGHVANQWSVGPAVVWAAAVVPVHLALTAAGVRADDPCGYAAPYQLAVWAVTFALSLVTLVYGYRLARLFAPPVAAATAAALTVLGTSVIAYGVVEPGMAHGPATAALAVYLCVWARSFGGTDSGRWFGVGLLLGATCLMRWQLATFAALPALEALWLVRTNRPRAVRAGGLLALAAVGSLVTFAPQMIAWTAVYGRPLVNPHPTAAEWLNPSFWTVLCSPDRSLFYWTPVALVGVLGLVSAARPGGAGGARGRILLAAVGLQIYAMAALIDRGVNLGSSFGFRLLTETNAPLVVGLAVLLRRAGPRRPAVVALAAGAAVAWNFLLMGVFARGVAGAETGPAGLVHAVYRYFIRRPLEAPLLVALAVALAVRIRREFDSPPAPVPARPAGEFGLAAVLARFGFKRPAPR
jgi:hypothetical protein